MMAEQVLSEFKYRLGLAQINMETDDIRVALVMTNTTCGSENVGIATVSAYTTLDECNGANYVRKALQNKGARKAADGSVQYYADNVTWTALGAGTRSVAGVLVFKNVTNDADSIPADYLPFPAPVVLDGNNFTITWAPEGYLVN
jgi:hypothetical protein